MNLVYLASVPWASFAQRPQKFVAWFRQQTAGQVLWIDPYPTRLPNLGDFTRARETSDASIQPPANMRVLRPRALPIEPLAGLHALNSIFWNDILKGVEACLKSGPTILGVGKPSRMALRILEKYQFERSFYDAMDDYPAFYSGLSRRSMAQREKELANHVSKMLVSSTELKQRWQGQPNLELALNACDLASLPSAKRNSDSRVLGYVGTIGAWFDWDLVISLAKAAPKFRVSLIGPVFSPPPGKLPPNIELRPPLPHPEAMKALLEFRAGLIPFKKTRLTKSVDPIKYYEYRAMGLPILSSDFGEMRFRRNEDGVFLLDQNANSAKVETVIDSALAYDPAADVIEDFRRHNSWEARFGAINLFK